MEYAYLTDPGKVREHNEDSVIVVKNQAGEIMMAVADGMGGHRTGEIASSIAITHIGKRFLDAGTIGVKEDAIKFIKEIVSEANVLLYKHTSSHPESTGMGTTIVIAVLTKDFLLFGNIGDSSGYVLRNDKLHKITTDHTLVGLLVQSGKLTESEAKDHPRKNVLMKALGATSSVEMDIIDVENDIDGILLCSDGVTNMLDDSQMLKVISEKMSIEDKLKKIIVKCNNRGGTDNISIALLLKDGVNNDK